jgi:hypothetical protein
MSVAVPLEVDLYYSGAWHDITSRVYQRDRIQITRGRPNESTSADPSDCRLTLDNRDGMFSSRNPSSPLYRLIGRNTLLRVLAPGGVGLVLDGLTANSKASTPDAAALDIAGDIELRAEFRLDEFDATVCLLSKGTVLGNVGTQFSYALLVGFTNGVPHLTIRWSTDGTTILSQDHNMPQIRLGRRIAVKATLDVNNGAGGRTAAFYTAPTIDGTYTQAGASDVTAGTTSIFSGTGSLVVGQSDPLPVDPFPGTVYGVQVRNGIGGAAAANPVFSAQAVGTTSFADAAGRTWTVAASASIAHGKVCRFFGELSGLPQAWDTTGSDVYVPIQAAGVGRRLGQGQPPAVASLRQFLGQTDGVYWPLDDNTLAKFGKRLTPAQQAGASDSQVSFRPTGTGNTYEWGTGDLDPALPKTLSITSTGAADAGSFTGYVGAATSITYAYVDFVYKSSGLGLLTLLVRDYLQNTWHVKLRADGLHYDVQLTRDFYDSSVEGVVSESIADSADLLTALTDGELHYVRASFTDNGTGVDYAIYIDGISVLSGTRASASVGGVADIFVTYGSADEPVALGHVAVYTSANATVPTTAAVLDTVFAYAGEAAADRLERLCTDNDLAFDLIGTATDTPAMGGQGQATLVTLLQECAETDIGTLYEPREQLGYAYRTRTDLYNQPAAVTLDYSAFVFGAPPNPTDDDFSTRNDVTVSNTSSSGSAQATLTEGPLSIQAPPDGINTYPTTASVNLETDGTLDDQANWRLALSTIDEARYPSLTLNLLSPAIANNLALAAQIIDLDVTDRLVIENLPAWLPPDDSSQLVLGYTEELWQFGWTVALNCTPESPYQVAVYGSSALRDGARYDAERSTLDADCTSGATSLAVTAGRGTELWTTDAGEFPFDIGIGGEQITVTDIDGGDVTFVGVGTAATANNAGVTPGLPAGVAVGDVVFIFASIRNSGTGTVILPTSWTSLATFGNCRLMARVYDGIWTMPVVGFLNGVANADTIAQSCAFRNVSLSDILSVSTLNGSAQNVSALGAAGSGLADKDTLTLCLGWKQDDWTSVDAQPNTLGTRLIELQEAVATAGDDAAQVWNYAIRGLDGSGGAPAITWTVTGGAAAISRVLVMFLYRAAQTFTVTRSVNGVVKAHTEGDSVALWDTPRYAL